MNLQQGKSGGVSSFQCLGTAAGERKAGGEKKKQKWGGKVGTGILPNWETTGLERKTKRRHPSGAFTREEWGRS